MLELSKQVVSLESAKRLKELGCVQDSLFWWCIKPERGVLIPVIETTENSTLGRRKIASAYTVAELGEMLPKMVNGWPLHMEFYKGWLIYYKYKNILEKIQSWSMSDTEAECRAKMLIHLLENKLMEVKNG